MSARASRKPARNFLFRAGAEIFKNTLQLKSFAPKRGYYSKRYDDIHRKRNYR